MDLVLRTRVDREIALRRKAINEILNSIDSREPRDYSQAGKYILLRRAPGYGCVCIYRRG